MGLAEADWVRAQRPRISWITQELPSGSWKLVYLAHGVSWILSVMTTPRPASSAAVDSKSLARRIMPFIEPALIVSSSRTRVIAVWPPGGAHLQPAQRLPSGELVFLVGQQVPAETMDIEFPGPILAADRHAYYLQVLNGHWRPLIRLSVRERQQKYCPARPD